MRYDWLAAALAALVPTYSGAGLAPLAADQPNSGAYMIAHRRLAGRS